MALGEAWSHLVRFGGIWRGISVIRDGTHFPKQNTCIFMLDFCTRKQLDLENMTSRLIRKAYRLAENAARGRFPSLDPLLAAPSRPKFDYEALHKAHEKHRKWLDGAIEGKPRRNKSGDLKENNQATF